ncbi:MAG: response regulator transcription factor [Bacteroidetes bacterium]|nr:response regulator transcription factor [Bacteroidota bacterium]MBK7969090.1 response regulator transcription factor [Bacteroidota bacterium]MBK8413437.1 response regulator transcription factor [Bacteroidota bacterium]MBK9046348.1 response regulator transcription factor [Bacteroidota bacterium]MBK9424937.1 response regulator transcription factor [Bacteroidota bacterium]
MITRCRILLVEDDPNFGAVLRDYLILNNYDVVLCNDGKKGWNRFINEQFDLCILDVMMPELDGYSLAIEIRKVNPGIPLVFLTAKTMKEDLIAGFNAGADDYITKPFDSEILLLKLKALLKRTDTKTVNNDEQFEFVIGNFSFNSRQRVLSNSESQFKLSPREADLLRLLCLHVNDVLPREKALKLIWGEDSYFTGRSMDVFLTRLRKYFKSDPAIEILNVHSNGFRLLIRN